MLNGIDPLLSGELLKILDEMGHGDRLVLADRNFPAYTAGLPVVRMSVDTATALDAILSVFPLDTFVDRPLARMGPQDDPEAENDAQTAVLEVARRRSGGALEFEAIRRMDFYDHANTAFAVVQTLETAPYCDFILTKGVV
ncbi:RbsD/FucU family protein [soil metagenome]